LTSLVVIVPVHDGARSRAAATACPGAGMRCVFPPYCPPPRHAVLAALPHLLPSGLRPGLATEPQRPGL